MQVTFATFYLGVIGAFKGSARSLEHCVEEFDCEKFSKVSAVVSLLYKVTIELTFENVYLQLGSRRAICLRQLAVRISQK